MIFARKLIRKSQSPLAYLYGIGFCMGVCTNATAGIDVCQPPASRTELAMAYSDDGWSSLEHPGGAIRQNNRNFHFLYRGNEDRMFGIGHQYTIMNADKIDPQTNGHLHTIYFPWYQSFQKASGKLRVSLAPALSASSNVVSDMSLYNGDSLQLLASATWLTDISSNLDLEIGLCGDNSFGEYLIYPSISFYWRPTDDWSIELGLPRSKIAYQLNKSLATSLRFLPDGTEWNVRDRSLENQSQLVYEAFLLEWALSWSLRETLQLSASVGRVFEPKFAMTLQDGSKVDLKGDPVTRIGAALIWQF